VKKNRGKSIYISSFIVLLLLAGLGFWRFGHYKVVVRGGAETEEHEDHEREQHAPKISDDQTRDKDKEESNPHTPGKLVRINDLQRKKLDITFGTAGPGRLLTTIELPGEIVMDADRLAHIMPLLPGVVKEVRKKLGDAVRQGDVMAVIESRELADAKAAYLAASERVTLAQATFTREEQLWQKGISAKQEYLDARKSLSEGKIERRSAEQKLRFLGFSDVFIENFQKHPDRSLTRYVITAPLNGTVVQKHITLGEKVSDDTEIFTIADLSHVWIDLSVPQKDLVSIKKGQRARISLGFSTPDAEGKISYVSPMADRKTRTALARVVLPNPGRKWRPGLFVKARISVGEVQLPLVVPKEALQRLENENVVFVEAKGGYEPRHVSVGRSDGSNVEILSGLSAGERYVAKGGFELKAVMMTQDLGAHAGHGH
jgi:cobalt-zinc-cadmium efflux system membrane fusion protein